MPTDSLYFVGNSTWLFNLPEIGLGMFSGVNQSCFLFVFKTFNGKVIHNSLFHFTDLLMSALLNWEAISSREETVIQKEGILNITVRRLLCCNEPPLTHVGM